MIWHGRHLGSRLRSRGSRSVAAGRDIDCRLVLPRARYRGNRQDSQSYAVNWHFTAPPGTHKRLEGQQGRVEQPLQGPLYSAGRTVQSIGTGSGGGDSRQGRRAVHFRRSQAAINQSIDQSINRSIDQIDQHACRPDGPLPSHHHPRPPSAATCPSSPSAPLVPNYGLHNSISGVVYERLQAAWRKHAAATAAAEACRRLRHRCRGPRATAGRRQPRKLRG